MQQLTFTQQGSAYSCTLPATKGVVQVRQTARGRISVTANLPGLPPSVIAIHENPYGNSVIFQVDVPQGVTLTLKSATEVTQATWMQL